MGLRRGPLGRPKTAKPGHPTTLSFRAEPELIGALDDEAKRMADEKKGLKLSRTDVVKVLLWEALEARNKGR
jgi:hypothetical protein